MTAAAVAALFARTDREIWLVTSQAGSQRGGLIATFVNAASIVPELPRVLVGMAKHHHTHGLVEASGAFGLHLLGERHLEWVYRFGLASGPTADKFAGLEVQQPKANSPLLHDALGWLDCKVEAKLDTGDRTVYLAEVIDAASSGDEPPLTVSRMVQLAPADRRAELRRLMQRDAALDAAAIRAWRQGFSSGLA
jgi:flavin reductase (DIM6/NTAB) family NADH-FMN oxidoreductase RutF